MIEAEELIESSDTETVFPAKGSVSRKKIQKDLVQEVELVAAYGASDKAAQLAFMEEMVDIMVHESADPNAETIVETWVNGIAQRFIRGQVQTARRKYVEVLARAKSTGIQTREATDYNGDRTTAIVKHTALKYPFSVLKDINPKGATWLKQVMAQ
jgi:hypothetical protein